MSDIKAACKRVAERKMLELASRPEFKSLAPAANS